MIVVIGNVATDVSFEVDRLPLPGETRLARGRSFGLGGKGLNQATVSRRAGAEVRFCAVVGDDLEGERVRGQLSEERIARDDLVTRPGPTDSSIIYVADSGENCIVSTDLMAKSLTIDDTASLLGTLGSGDSLLMQGNLTHAATRECLERARRRGARTLVNAAPIAFAYDDLWHAIDVLILNAIEIRDLSGAQDPGRGAKMLRDAGVGLVVATLGADGALITTQDASFAVSAPKVDAVDTVGAGDVFCGVFAAALDAEIELRMAARWAVEAAARSVTRRGTAGGFPSAAELKALFQDLGHGRN